MFPATGGKRRFRNFRKRYANQGRQHETTLRLHARRRPGVFVHHIEVRKCRWV
jgi:hypothetical protein